MGFDSFLGNPQAVAAVREMLAGGRVPGALLFVGPEGVGKKTLALMLTKALVCERDAADFCDQCARCRKAEHSSMSAVLPPASVEPHCSSTTSLPRWIAIFSLLSFSSAQSLVPLGS